jgi:hypothetical protein
MNAIASKQGCSLTDLDWRVVEIARSNGPRSIRPDGHVARFLRDFCGLPITPKLVNERLEALRRFCVRAWHSNLIRTTDVGALMDAGYSLRDASQILSHVGGHRGFTPSIQKEAV